MINAHVWTASRNGIRLTRTLFLISAIVFMASCSSLDPIYATSSQYRHFVNQNLIEQKLYDRGRLLVSAKVLPASAQLKIEQEKFIPGFAFPYDPSRAQLIVALSLSSEEVFRKNGLKFYLDEVSAKDFKEETQRALIESLYSFGHPFHRILYVDFGSIRPGSHTLKIYTPQGPIETKVVF